MTKRIEFKYVVTYTYEDGGSDHALALFRFTKDEPHEGLWLNEVTILNVYGDEPDAETHDGWRGEVVERQWDYDSVPWDFKDMHIICMDAQDLDADLGFEDYDPDQWEFDGMTMVRAA